MIGLAPPQISAIVIDRDGRPLPDALRMAIERPTADAPEQWRQAGFRELGRVGAVSVLLREAPFRESTEALEKWFLRDPDRQIFRMGDLPPNVREAALAAFGVSLGKNTRIGVNVGIDLTLRNGDRTQSLDISAPLPKEALDECFQHPLESSATSGVPTVGVSLDPPTSVWKVHRTIHAVDESAPVAYAKVFALLDRYDEERRVASLARRKNALDRTDLGEKLRPGGEGPLGGPVAAAEILSRLESMSYAFPDPEKARTWGRGASIQSRRVLITLTVGMPSPDGKRRGVRFKF